MPSEHRFSCPEREKLSIFCQMFQNGADLREVFLWHLWQSLRWRQRQRSRPRLEMETKRGSDANMSASFNVCIKSFRHLKEARQNRNDKLVFGNSESEKAGVGGAVEKTFISPIILRREYIHSTVSFSVNYN